MTLYMQPSPSTQKYVCSECGHELGEFSATRALECFGVVICGRCAFKKSEEERMKEEQGGV